MKKLGLLTVALVLSMALPVFGAEYVGEVRNADDYVDFFAEDEYIQFLSMGKDSSDINMLTVDDYSLSPLTFNGDYSIGTGLLEGDVHSFRSRSSNTVNSIFTDSEGHNYVLSWGRPYYSHYEFLENTAFYTADIVDAFEYNGHTAYIAKEGTDTYGLYYINYVNSSPEINRITDFTAVDNEVPVFAFDYLNLTGLVTYNNNELTVYTSYGDSWNKVITQPISGDVSSMDLDACYNKLVISGGDLGNMVKYIDLAKETSTDILIDTENTPLNGITKIAMTEDSLYIALYDTQDNSIDIYRESLPSEKIGDVDRNGVYTSNDAALALSYVLKNVDSGLDEEQIRLAGVCGGTHMTANDAAYILARSLDNSIVFPVEKY